MVSLDLVIVSRERSDLRNHEGDFVKKDVFSSSHGRKKQSLIPMRNQTWGAQILRPKALPLTSIELYGELVFIQV